MAKSRNSQKHANRKAARNENMRKELPRLELWTVHMCDCNIVLSGNVFNHSSFGDGDHVTTSPIIRLDHLYARTESGTCYLLGTPSDAYLEYRSRNNLGPISTKVFHYRTE
jgi:hypothetical protein